MNKTNTAYFRCKNYLTCLQQLPASLATVSVHHGGCSADCPSPEGCENDRIIITQVKSFKLCPASGVRCKHLPEPQLVQFCSLSLLENMTNGVKLVQGM